MEDRGSQNVVKYFFHVFWVVGNHISYLSEPRKASFKDANCVLRHHTGFGQGVIKKFLFSWKGAPSWLLKSRHNEPCIFEGRVTKDVLPFGKELQGSLKNVRIP